MQGSPSERRSELRQILGERYSEHMVSKWDSKVINGTGLSVYDLRWAVGVRVER